MSVAIRIVLFVCMGALCVYLPGHRDEPSTFPTFPVASNPKMPIKLPESGGDALGGFNIPERSVVEVVQWATGDAGEEKDDMLQGRKGFRCFRRLTRFSGSRV